MSKHDWLMIPALIVPAAVSAPACATHYLTVAQAQKAMYPEATQFVRADVLFTAETKQLIFFISSSS